MTYRPAQLPVDTNAPAVHSFPGADVGHTQYSMPYVLQERSTSGRVPAKLKLGLKQGGREQQVRSYTLPFPQPATHQLQATALGSVDTSACQSSAVHTLIPNLAPRSRLQHSSLGRARGRDRGRGPSQHRQCGSAPKDSEQLGDGHTQLHGQLPEDSALQASAGKERHSLG